MLLEQGLGPQPPREVTAPLEIQSLLKALHAARTPLEVRFEERAQTFQSYLVELDTAGSMLYIDELIPSVGDKWMTQGESFRVDAWLDGVHLRWQHSDVSTVALGGSAALTTIACPTTLPKLPRRGAYRASVRPSAVPRLELVHSADKRAFAGELRATSVTGCKLRLAGNQLQALQPGERYERSQLQLEDSPLLDLAVEIRHRTYHEAGDETHVGLHRSEE